MYHSIHKDFINSSIKNILKDVISANRGVGNGIETFPLCDYVMQSVFLKMTGYQEQKMKCIIWEIATIDFDYRRALLGNDDKLGECSSYSDKNKIYKRLVSQILKYNSKFDIKQELDAKNILNETIDYIKLEFKGTNLSIWAQGGYNYFSKNIRNLIEAEHFLVKDSKGNTNLFVNVLQDKYEVLYNHRNRIAHNTSSYQQNLPTLKTIANPSYRYENYFIYFCILVLIDQIFIELYEKYLREVGKNTNL